MSWFKRKPVIDKSCLPRHIAIIMDGNGRWAKRRGLPRSAGHAAGSENFRKIATHCKKIGIMYLTVYAFSTENWKRPKDEVGTIMDLLRKYLAEAVRDAEKNELRLRFFGDLSMVDADIVERIVLAEHATSRYDGLQLNICLNYGGRREIVEAARILAEECKKGVIAPSQIDEAMLASRLGFAGVPDPDLLIRPSGEFRLSNFLLWESAYSEYYFTDTLWPGFSEAHLEEAIAEYQKRSRRYGGL